MLRKLPVTLVVNLAANLSKNLGFVCLLLAMSMFAQGCAYRAGYGDRQIPGGYKAIAVPVFKNNTHETGVEVFFTNSLVREIERSRIGRVALKDDAQVTLEGQVDNIYYLPANTVTDAQANFLPTDTTLNTEYRINVLVSMRLRRNSDQQVLWQGSFHREQSYLTPRIGIQALTGANALYNHSARNQNIETMAADLMAEAHDRLTENF